MLNCLLHEPRPLPSSLSTNCRSRLNVLSHRQLIHNIIMRVRYRNWVIAREATKLKTYTAYPLQACSAQGIITDLLI
jgi:hypothetical protein